MWWPSDVDPVLIWKKPERRVGPFHFWWQLLCAGFCIYFYRHLPMPGKAVLLLGVVAVLMTLAEMTRIEKGIWLLLVLSLMWIENKSIDKDREETSRRDNELIERTAGLVNQVGALAPMVDLTRKKVGDLDNELQVSITNRDTQRTIDLRRQLTAAKKQYADTSLALLLTVAPGIVTEMQRWAIKWSDDDQSIQQSYRRTLENQTKGSAEYKRISQEEQLAKDGLNAKNTKQVRALITSAKYLRDELRDKFSNQPQIREEHDVDAIFDEVFDGQSITFYDMIKAARYMGAFVSAHTPVTAPVSNLTVTVQ